MEKDPATTIHIHITSSKINCEELYNCNIGINQTFYAIAIQDFLGKMEQKLKSSQSAPNTSSGGKKYKSRRRIIKRKKTVRKGRKNRSRK